MRETPLLVLIDGTCALCNGTAAWLARRNVDGAMIFATNQGEVARIAGEPPGGDMGTIVVWDGSRRLVRSAAVLLLLRTLGGKVGIKYFRQIANRNTDPGVGADDMQIVTGGKQQLINRRQSDDRS